jgi:hypothetical protein
MNELDQEKYSIVVRQCCDLIDEKRMLQKQFDELYCKHIHDLQVVHRLAKFHDEACIAAADIIHVANNFDSFASPLQQIRDRMKSLLISPWHQENIVDKVKEYMNDRTKVPVFESTLCPGEDLRDCSAPNPSDDCAALRGPVNCVVGRDPLTKE